MKKALLVTILLVGCFSLSYAKTNADTTELKQYTGTYTFPAGSVVSQVVINLVDGGLRIISTAGESEFNRIAADTFSIVSFQGVAFFKRNDAKQITGIVIDAAGYYLEGTKIDPKALARPRSVVYALRSVVESK